MMPSMSCWILALCAVSVLQAAANQACQQLQQAKGGRPGVAPPPRADMDELPSLYVEVQLQLLETLELLADMLAARGEAAQAVALQQRAEEVARQLLELAA